MSPTTIEVLAQLVARSGSRGSELKGELVRIQTSDGIELDGLYCEAEGASGPAVIHIHGMAGNFYESRFVDAIADRLASLGIAFLTANNRGHGSRS